MTREREGSSTAEGFFAGSELGLATLSRVRDVLATHPDVTERTTTSQVAFRRRTGFAFLWLPGRYLRHPAAEVVLSVGLPRRVDSSRFKEVAHPAGSTWIHHLEVHAVGDVDDEVAGWLREAADEAG
ncbi:MAG TPA: DUF5655 domain-containing protein [Ornithinibacter sp.]|nr:DUF5655 domain-containing protein [Ornithinibacter sp.]